MAWLSGPYHVRLDRPWADKGLSYSRTLCFDEFVECFRKHETFCQFVTKIESENWGDDG